MTAMFEFPDLGAMAAALDRHVPASLQILVPIQTHGNGTALFALPGAGGNVLSFVPLSRAIDQALQGPQPFYGLHGSVAHGANSVEAMAAANIEAMRAVQPHGPYRLLGHSFGGVVAYEMTRQLLVAGETVDSLQLLDTLAPALMARCADTDVGMLNEAAPELVAGAVDAAQMAAYLKAFEADLAALRHYQPQALPGAPQVTLLRIRGLHGKPPDTPDDFGWSALLCRAPSLRHVDGEHSTMLQKDHARQLALHLLEPNEAPHIERQ